MKKVIFFIGCMVLAAGSMAQGTVKTYKVGIFAPLYLDSLFNASGYKYGKDVPKFAMAGLDFVQGAQVALDSIRLWDENVEAYIHDSKAYTKTIPWLIKTGRLDSLNLIIGSVKDAEYRQLADFALLKNIPFISVTYPNDAGITANPFTVIMNSTLRAHCEAIYSYIVQNHGTDNIFLLRKKGAQEDKVAGYFKTINEQDGKAFVNIQTIIIDSSFSSDQLQARLDSSRQTIIIGGSLEETFAGAIANACNDLHAQYPITLIGMPNWDGFRTFLKKGNYEEFPVYFTSPYHNNKWDMYSRMVISAYQKKYKTRPADMAFKGFEAVYLFTKLLVKHPNDLMSNLNDKSYKVFCEYNFRPVSAQKNAAVPDYIENKHLYFVKLLNGVASKAW
jgi:ABC-type branched-subunit amino acid transport system substrate-binding protein